MTITNKDLTAILKSHARWLKNPKKGAFADLSGTNLRLVDLTGANLAEATLIGADLTNANLTRANLAGANLKGANLTRACLLLTNCAAAYMSDANLSWANLTHANLFGAGLHRADMTGAKLVWANVAGVDMTDVNFIPGGMRSDGYDFYAIKEKTGAVMLRAGCHYMTFENARKHWLETRKNTRLGDESLAILNHLEHMAKISGWLP